MPCCASTRSVWPANPAKPPRATGRSRNESPISAITRKEGSSAASRHCAGWKEGRRAERRGLEGVRPVVAQTLEQQAYLSPFVVRKGEVVGPRVGRQLRQQALLATGLALAGVLGYIGLRFPAPGAGG